MNQKLSKFLRVLVVAAAVAFSFAGCKGDEPETPGSDIENEGGDVTNAYMFNKGKDEPFRFPAGWEPCLNLREKEIFQSIRPVTK